MSFKSYGAGLALFGLLVAPTPSFAVTGAGGPDLPEYARAVGTIENGPGSTGMTIEEARRVIARERGEPDPTIAPRPRKHRTKRHLAHP